MKLALLTLGSLLGALCLGQAPALADTIIGVTETHYDANLRPDCVAVRMNALTFADAPSNACTPKASVGSNGPDHITQSVYDSAGQVRAVYRGVGTSSIIQYAYYDYTPNGLKSLEIDASHNKTTFTYDGFDRLSKVQYPITTTGSETSSTTDYESFGYDANGNRTSWRRRDGNTISYSFDALNRQTYEGGDALADISTAYDLQGHVLYKHFTSGNIGVDYAYDGLGRVLSTTDMNGRMVRYAYNAASARTGMIYPDGNNLIYALDTLNRVGNIHWTDGTVMVWQGYNNLGQRRVLDRGAVSGSGGSTAYTYDNFGRLTGLAINMDGTSTAHDMSWSFVYNPANQLANWTSTGATYDYVEAATSSTSKTYDGLNRDATIAAVSGGYDTKGNVTKDASRVMTYDIYNRLLTIASLATPTTPYMRLVYDPEGRLANVTTSGGTKEFLYDGTNLIGEYLHVGASTTVHTSDTMTDRYVHGTGTDEPVVWYSGATITAPRFLFANYQGSVIAYTTTAGAFSESYAYDPYGVPVNSTGGTSWFGSRFRYTGQIALPEAGLYYYKARVYDPVAGRFLQTDPVGSKDDLDLYAYVGGDPINKADPSGKCVEDFCIGEAAAVGWCLGGGCEAAVTATINLIGVTVVAVNSWQHKNDNQNGDSSNSDNRSSGSNNRDQDSPNAPKGNNGNGPVHGGSKHNDAVDSDIQDMRDNGYTDIRKNQTQVDANGNRVGNNRPDAQGTRPDGQREYREQDTNPNRSAQHGETIKRNDPRGICILNICI